MSFLHTCISRRYHGAGNSIGTSRVDSVALRPVDEMFVGLSSESSISNGFTRGLPYDTEFRQVRYMYVTIGSFFLCQTWRPDRILF